MNSIYIIFSHTTTLTGRFIRAITKHEYNHVSLSLFEDLQVLYSFSRHFNKAPFYGGLTEESPLRYKDAKVKVCKIALTDEEYKRAQDLLGNAVNNKDDYVYNFFSAAFFPFKKKIYVKNSFTCVEFAVHVLNRIGVRNIQDKYYSIIELEEILKNDTVYEGPMPLPEKPAWGNDIFNFRPSYYYSAKVTAKNMGRLARRFYNGRK